MSMITELIDRLKYDSDFLEKHSGETEEFVNDYREAADIIQLLSEKLRASQTESCDDCVSRQAVLDIISKYEESNDERGGFYIGNTDNVVSDIRDLPSVQPQPKTGYWIRVDDTKVKCSNCDIIHLIAQYPNGVINYCPNCGEKMVEPQKSEE